MIEFGLSRLRMYSNGIETGCAITTGGAGQTAVVASGSVWIGGHLVYVSGGHDVDISAISAGSGTKYIFARLASGASSTATLDATSVNPKQQGWAVIGKITASSGSCTSLDTSGTTGMRPFGRAMNCSLNLSYDQAVARGGTLIFGNDIKLYNGACEGTLEYAAISGANLASMLGGDWTSGGVGSGTLSLSATQRPLPFMIETQQITDGVTSTIRINKCYSSQIGLKLDRENYLMPSVTFQAVGNQEGDILQWTI